MQLRQFPGSPTGWPTSRRSSGSRRSSASTASTTSRSSRPTSLWPSAERRRFESRPAEKTKQDPPAVILIKDEKVFNDQQSKTYRSQIFFRKCSEIIRKRSEQETKETIQTESVPFQLRLPPPQKKKSINCTYVSKLKSKLWSKTSSVCWLD